MADKFESKEHSIVPFSELSEVSRNAWAQLVGKQGLNPSLLPGWLDAVLKSWQICPTKIQTFKTSRGEELSCLVPFQLEKRSTYGLPLNVLSLTSNLVSYHPEIISSENIKQSLEDFLKSTIRWDKALIQGVVDNSPTAEAVRELCFQEGWLVLETPVDFSPYLPLDGSWDDLLATKKRKFRYKVRKRNEHLEQSDDLSMVWYRTVDDTRACLNAFFAIEAKSWKAEQGVEVAANNREGRYYSELLPFLAEQGALLANVLWHKDKPIAYSLCCNWNGWIGHLKTGFDLAFEDVSAGALVIDASLQAAYDLGAKEFDFLGTPGKMQPEPHKLHWTKQVRRHISFEIYFNKPLPRLVGLAKRLKKKIDQ